MPKVSVIVPVYNVEQYLDKCLNSLVNQTLRDIEIIIVNDGTKDNSQAIIDKYVQKYENIKALKKENGGLSSARNYGIKYSTGEYIGFVDSDDWVEKDMFEKLYNKAITEKFDMVVCDLKYIYADYGDLAKSNIKKDMFGKEDIKKCFTNIYPAAWNKIYKTDILKKYNILFKQGVWFEDVEFIYRLLPYIKSIGVVNVPLYNYLQREGAITSCFDERLYHYIENFNGIIQFYKETKMYEEYKKEIEYAYIRYIYATFIKRCINFEFENYKSAVDEAIKNVKDKFPKYRYNLYFYKSVKGLYLLLFNKKIANILYKYKRKKREYIK